jgi:uncharacterized RDD family membrane protein YckC
MFCSMCGAAARADQRFCGICGTRFPLNLSETLIVDAVEPRFCASCGLLTPADACYCRTCGAPTALAPVRPAPSPVPPAYAGYGAYGPNRGQSLPPGFHEYAPLWRRFIASTVIDTFLLYVILGISAVASVVAVVALDNPAAFVLMAAGPFVYLWWGNATGRSPSKQAMGIRVVRADTGAPPGWSVGLIRTLGYCLSWGFFWIGCLWALFDEKHRALHDLMAGTIVVREPRHIAHPPWRDSPPPRYIPDLRPAPNTRPAVAPETRPMDQMQPYDATPSP